MTKSIGSYKELLKEKERLELLLSNQKKLLRQDVDEIKQELEPVKNAVSMVSKFFTRDSSNLLLTTASDTVIDMLIKRVVLSKAGWLTRFLVPFLIKNFSSHVLADNKNKLLRKLFSWIGKKNANGQMHKSKAGKKEAADEEDGD